MRPSGARIGGIDHSAVVTPFLTALSVANFPVPCMTKNRNIGMVALDDVFLTPKTS